MLTNKIRLSGPETFDPEDILSSSLGVIFPDDIINQHGDATCSVIYTSSRFGDVELSLADPQGERNRSLFSHFLWNSGVQLGVFIEEGDDDDEEEGSHGQEAKGSGSRVREPTDWNVQGEAVLELGAGTGLAGIVAALAGAARVVISDYPAPEVLENIRQNVARNVDASRRERHPEISREIEVRGHEWGLFDSDAGFAAANKEAFGRILVADCLWMPWQHGNLLRSIRWFLAQEGRAWVVAGFHTGRAKMRGFFENDAVREAGLVVESIWERNVEGREREWVVDRGVEDTGRKRWLVVGILKRLD